MACAFIVEGTDSGLDAAYQNMHVIKLLRSSNAGRTYSADAEISAAQSLGPQP